MMEWLETQNAGVQITILTIPLIAVIIFGAVMKVNFISEMES